MVLPTINALALVAAVVCVPSGTADDVNEIRSIRTVNTATLGADSAVEIELFSTRAFPVRDELMVLRIGEQHFFLSRYAEDGNLNTVIFLLTRDEWEQAVDGDPVVVQYGMYEAGDPWDFGLLDKQELKPLSLSNVSATPRTNEPSPK